MLPTPSHALQYLAGAHDRLTSARPLSPYEPLVLEFLGDVSRALFADAEAKRHPDVIAFAYWCRGANTSRLKQEFAEPHLRLGLGIVFHIAPSNVPINFAFSFAFSLLAGNANIVRVPTRDLPQTGIVCRIINRLLTEARYETLAGMTAFVRYPQDDAITREFSALCNARVIWGGDQTINSIRKLPIPERSIEVTFADRYSLCVIEGSSILRADHAAIVRLAGGFYNDIYLFDQNACSSPHLVMWLGTRDVLDEAKRIFWGAVAEVAEARYDLQPVQAVDKYLLLCENAIEVDEIAGFEKHGNHLYRLALAHLPGSLETLRGRFGLVYEHDTERLDTLAPFITAKFQTLTYFGLDRARLQDFVVANRLPGIDRIVPIGTALDIGVIWDGYDIVRSLSRIIDLR